MKVFLERNKYEMFKHPREAQTALRDKWILTAYKGNLGQGKNPKLRVSSYFHIYG